VEGLSGVWVETKTGVLAKIAAIGVKVDARGISRHGFALNVSPDMSYWDGIIGCGLKGHAAASLAQLLDATPSMDEVIQSVINSFAQVFQFEVLEKV
jgi:lipoyl(octanoyl) transferase